MKKLVKNKNGQALAELAIFGALLLFCLAVLIEYGLVMNYQQNSHMEAFRKGLQKAAENQITSMEAQYVLLNDKPIPNPQDPMGIPGRRAISSSASITWGSGLRSYVPNSYGEEPRVYYDINGQVVDYTMAGIWIRYYAATYWGPCADEDKWCGDANGDGDNDDWGEWPDWWVEMNIDCDEDFTGDDGCVPNWVGVPEDADNDGEDEVIMNLPGSCWNDTIVQCVDVMDFQEGEINFSEEGQGLQRDYTELLTIDNASLENSEDANRNLNTTDLTGVTDTFNRTIVKNDGTSDTITTTLTPPITYSEWETDK